MKRVNKEELHKIFVGIKKNNELEFNSLCKDYRWLVYGAAFSILKNKEDSEEIVQLVFMKIYELEKEKLPSKNEANWMYTLTKNETISFLRNKKEYIDMETIYEITDENDEVNKITDKIDFNKLISKLEDKEKEIVSLKIISNLSFNQIARLLNEPASTIKWRYYKAVHTLKILIGNFGMFIVTLVIGLKVLFNEKSSHNIKQEEDMTNQTNDKNEEEKNIENNREEGNKKQEASNSLNNDIQEDNKDIINNNEITEIAEERVETESKANYFGIGAVIISFVFLIVTIITLVFFTKYQLKLRKKSSK